MVATVKVTTVKVTPVLPNCSHERQVSGDSTSRVSELSYQGKLATQGSAIIGSAGTRHDKEKGLASLPIAVQAIIYTIALGFAVFVLLVPALEIGVESDSSSSSSSGSGSSSSSSSGGHRRLGGGGGDGHKVITNIAYCTFSAGMVTYFVYLAKQPMLLGYLLGGVLVGPIGLGLIQDHTEILTISELGLIFLLFMIGLELDLHELLAMGKVVLVTGFCQFPMCAIAQVGIFAAFASSGLTFGNGQYSTLYVGLCCGISSTMIVVKTLSEKMETTSRYGRLTIGILIFQDIWAIIVLAIQPNMSNPEVLGILKTFAWILVLIIVSMTYSKLVLPGVMSRAGKSNEMMLVLSLAWCFFVCCMAIMPFVGLSMELAALIAGVSIATFPYSIDFNAKIKYIRDFFLTLFFVGLGMQIPTPEFDVIGRAVLVATVVLALRWLGIFAVVTMLGGDERLAAIPTINLSEISEFALVICNLGRGYGHVDDETMAIIIWTFAILAVSGTYCISYNDTIFRFLSPCLRRMLCKSATTWDRQNEGGEDHEQGKARNILFLGFDTVGSTLIAELEEVAPEILSRCHVVDTNTDIGPPLKERNVRYTYGDISSEDVLEHAFHGTPDIILSTVPDYNLKGVSNSRILEMAKKLWPASNIVVTAQHSQHIRELYRQGAAYVLVTAKLGADHLAAMLRDHTQYANDLEMLDDRYCPFHAAKQKDSQRIAETLAVEVLGA